MTCVQLDGNADAVDFCPTPSFVHVLAAATYTLQQQEGEGAGASSSRLGTLSLFTLTGDLQLHKHDAFQTCGIFDIKWRPHSALCSSPLLAQAGSDGSITLYELQVHDTFHLCELGRGIISSSMCLSLDWNPHAKQQMYVSHSDGSLSVLDIEDSKMGISQHSNNAHSFEAWCVAADAWMPDVLFSGGDDCNFCCWDLRQGLSTPVFRDRKTHMMGVCSIQSSPFENNFVASGSYDENLRIWDMRMPTKPLVQQVLGLGGGVWKLKWSPFDKALMAAACMHNGVMVIKIQDNEVTMVTEYKKHDSLAYGVDWCKAPLSGNVTDSVGVFKDEDQRKDLSVQSDFGLSPVVVSCSFYDRALHVWRPDIY